MTDAATVQEAAAAAAHYPVCASVCVCVGGVYHTADTSHVGCIFFVRLALHFDDSCTKRGKMAMFICSCFLLRTGVALTSGQSYEIQQKY